MGQALKPIIMDEMVPTFLESAFARHQPRRRSGGL